MMTGEKVRKSLLYVEWTLAGIFLFVMTSSVFLEVLVRYVFAFSLSWPEEVARFSFIWCSLVGGAIAMERNKLHEIDILFDRLPEGVKPLVVFLVNILVLCILLVLFVYGIKLIGVVHRQVSPAMEIRMSYVYSAVPFAAGCMLITHTLNVIETLRVPLFGRKGKQP